MTAELTKELAQITGGINIEYRIDMGLVQRVLVLALIGGCFAQDETALAAAVTSKHVVWIKYRESPVNVGDPRFEYLDTARSSFITGAWYDTLTPTWSLD